MNDRKPRVAIVSTHPIQYLTPWFRALAARPDIALKVLYCHKASPRDQASAGFGVEFDWDVSLLDGYDWEYLPNVASRPGIRFWGIDTPDLARRIEAREFDVVVLNGWHYRSAWQAMRACRRSGTPVMARGDSNLHTPRHPAKMGAKWPFYRLFIPRLNACLPVGAWSREYFLHYGAPPSRIFEVPHTVDAGRISSEASRWTERRAELRRKWGFGEEDAVFIFPGKMIAVKRPLDFIRAVSEARRMGAPVAGLIVGDGPLREACEAEAKQSGAPFQFTGFLNQTEIVQAYVAADALASCGSETWAMVVNEAMVCGRPCFLSDQIGASPDLIDKGKTGDLFPLGDIEKFADLLRHYAGRQDLAAMGEAARRKIQAYSPEAAAECLADAVSATLGRPRAARSTPPRPIRSAGRKPHVAILTTHPIQYHTPWFRALARQPEIDWKILYCHKATPHDQAVAGFDVEFDWDVTLLDGYASEFLHNTASRPAIDFWGLNTPELSQRIARGEFDAVVLNGWHYRSAWQAMQACWRSGTPVLARGDSHLYSPRHFVKMGAKWPFYRFFIPRLDGCLSVGVWSREYFLHYGAQPGRIFEVHHTVDIERISIAAAQSMSRRNELRRKWNLRDEDIVFVFPGKLIPRKRPLDFVRAIARARQMGAPVAGLMVGDGILRQACEAEARKNSTPIQFAGFLNQTEIVPAYVAADALALPSHGGETWGLVINEAMVCGRACFLSDKIGCGPDLIEEGKTGAIFPCGDVEKFAAILKQYADPDTLRTMGENARRKVLIYSPQAAARNLVEAVLAALRERHSRVA